MANKRRAHKVKAPYRKYSGKAKTDDAGDDDLDDTEPENSVQLVLLSRGNKARVPQHTEVLPGDSILPLEVLSIIASYTEKPATLLLVSRHWYFAALPSVYNSPVLTAQNFGGFVDAVTADKALGIYVQDLDLTSIIQSGKNSSTARLLRRCSYRLERFVAPQSHFGFSPLLALRSCTRLRILDLGLVSETVDLPQLFNAIQEFQELEVVKFPRSSILCDRFDLKWPPNLRSLGLAGGISSEFLEKCHFPKTITRLGFSNCPFITTAALLSAIIRVGEQLNHLAVEYPLPQVDSHAMDTALLICPNLRSLTVSLDYVSKNLVDSDLVSYHPIKTLTLISTGMIGHTEKLKPAALLLATDNLADLIRVRVSLQLGWNTLNSAVAGLAAVLDERGGGLYVI